MSGIFLPAQNLFQFRPTESGLAANATGSKLSQRARVSIPSHGIWSCSADLSKKDPTPKKFQFRPTESGLAARKRPGGYGMLTEVSIPSHGIWSCSTKEEALKALERIGFNSVPRNLVLQQIKFPLMQILPGFQFRPTESGLAALPAVNLKLDSNSSFNSVPRNLVLQLSVCDGAIASGKVSIPSHGIWSCSVVEPSTLSRRSLSFNSVPRNLVLQQYGLNVLEPRKVLVSIPSHGIWSCSYPFRGHDSGGNGVSIPSHGIWSCSLC